LNTLLKNNPSFSRHARIAKQVRGNFLKQSKVDLLIQQHLLTHCWGEEKNLIKSIKKEIDQRVIEWGITCNLTRSVLMTSMLVEEEDKVKTVIDNQEVCDRIFTMKKLFCNTCSWVWQKVNESPNDRERLSVSKKEAEQAFEQLDTGTLELWGSKQQEHNAKRPAIEAVLVDALQKNHSALYTSLEAKIDYWCLAGTIRRWVSSCDG